MHTKTIFTLAAAAAIGSASYTIEHTKRQVLYSCDGPSGHAEIVNPNRYGLSFKSIFIETTSGNETKSDYKPVRLDPYELREDVHRFCQTGQTSTNLRFMNRSL